MRKGDWKITPEKYLNREELSALLVRADELKAIGEARGRPQPVRDWMIINTFLFTGLRRKEVCGLRCVDFRIFGGNSHLVVRPENGKGRKGRHVHLPREYKRNVTWYLRWKAERGEIQDEDAYFLRTARSPKYYPTGIYKRWKKHCPNHRLHDARHTNATLLYEATNSLRLVQKQLGHASIATTQVYADVSPEQSIAGANAMERLAASLRRNPRAMAAALPSGDAEALA